MQIMDYTCFDWGFSLKITTIMWYLCRQLMQIICKWIIFQFSGFSLKVTARPPGTLCYQSCCRQWGCFKTLVILILTNNQNVFVNTKQWSGTWPTTFSNTNFVKTKPLIRNLTDHCLYSTCDPHNPMDQALAWEFTRSSLLIIKIFPTIW